MTEGIDRAEVIRLAEEYGTPLYVYRADTLRERSMQMQEILDGAQLYYSLKANPNNDVAKSLRSTGCRVEVASGGELEKALKAGYTPDEVLFIGPGKTRLEITKAFELGVEKFVVDNQEELLILREQTTVRNVTVRVNPDFEAKGGKLTMSGAKPKQFGVDKPQLKSFIANARSLGIGVTGLHYYLGTRFLDADSIVANTRRIIEDAMDISTACGLSLEMLDMGGGFGVPYFENEGPLNLDTLRYGMRDCISTAQGLFPGAELAFESGRFLTADAGQLILGVLSCKTSYGTRFCTCDGGTNLNMAAVGTGSLGKRNFPSRLVKRRPLADRRGVQRGEPITVTGPLCTPDDTLLKSVVWDGDPQAGDFIVLNCVGAYGPTASPHSFLGHQFPNEVLH